MASEDRPSAAAGRMPYRAEIDGLRALAVGAVILNHFNHALLPSGYLGVDIFFVISGYVITASLAGRPTTTLRSFLGGFYERRIQRLVPALLVFVLITTLFSCAVNPKPLLPIRTAATALLGASNVYLYKQSTDYFAQSTELNPFTHTWSLGVEEQFYLLFPLLLWASGFAQHNPGGARRLFWLISLGSLLSLAGFVLIHAHDQSAAYFLMPFRFWELAAGCLLFLAQRNGFAPLQRLAGLPPLAPLLGLLAVLTLPLTTAVPATVAVVLLTSLWLCCVRRGTLVHHLFTLRPVVYVGLISYSLYLWHWGVLSLSRWTVGIHWWTVPWQLALMLLLAMLSYHCCETPLRRRRWWPRRRLTIATGVAASLAATAAVLAIGRNSVNSLYLGSNPEDSNLDELSMSAAGTSISHSHCSSFTATTLQHCWLEPSDPRQPRLVLLGDSHSSHYYPLLGQLRARHGIGLGAFVTSGQAFPAIRFTDNRGGSRERWLQQDLQARQFHAAALHRLRPGDIVMVSSRLEYYFLRNRINLEHQGLQLQLADADWQPIDEATALRAWLLQLDRLAGDLAVRGIRLVVMAPTPAFRGDPAARGLPMALCTREWYRPQLSRLCTQVYEESRPWLLQRVQPLKQALQQHLARHANAALHDPFDRLCPPDSSSCRNVVQGRRLFLDDDHLSQSGSLLVAGDFARFLQQRGWLLPPRP
ncbi:MAG: acyltransferase family protein [Synechococcaceae cyanobacterium]|nr:acyltransferase family protein [Synechococcaceae cyanobacterium]